MVRRAVVSECIRVDTAFFFSCDDYNNTQLYYLAQLIFPISASISIAS